MFKLNKETLLSLNLAMRKTIEEMDYTNPHEISAFASSLVITGNQINMSIIHNFMKE